MLTLIPSTDLHEYSAIPEPLKAQFQRLAQAVTAILRDRQQIHHWSQKLNLSVTRLRVIVGKFRRTGDWRTLINKAKAGPSFYSATSAASCSLPPQFLEYWKGLCSRNQRKSRPQYRALIRRWRSWQAESSSPSAISAASCSAFRIPGYDTCPPDCGKGYPSGWSERNLYHHLPSKFELTAQRIGRAAAAPYRPKVLTTRVGLQVMQYIMFDDFWHDFKVNVLKSGAHTSSRACRLLQFHALDLLSGCLFAHGTKPAIESEMTGVEERLKEREMVLLVAHVLSHWGFRRQGTVLIMEHRTATLPEAVEQRLLELTAGRVTVQRGPMEGAAAFAGAFAGRGKGNFRFKAHLESLGNLIHNETADTLLIPGQTGSNSRINCPEELHGREQYNNQLIRALQALPPERAQMLQFPFLELTKARHLLLDIFSLINNRIDHDLEGWLNAGFTQEEFRLPTGDRRDSRELTEWLPVQRLLAMPPENRAAIEALLASSDSARSADCQSAVSQVANLQVPLTRTRKLSPYEVFNHGRSDLVHLNDTELALLIGPSLAHPNPVTVRNGLLEYIDADIGQVTFEAVISATSCSTSSPPSATSAASCSNSRRLPDREKYQAALIPFQPDKLFLWDAAGRFIGVCPAWDRVSRADAEGLQRQFGRARKAESDLLRPIAQRGAELTKQRIAMHQHNAAVLKGHNTEEQNLSDLADLATNQNDKQYE